MLQPGAGVQGRGRRVAAATLALGMLIGLSLIATATNGLVIPFTGISIGGVAGEPPGTLVGGSGTTLVRMSGRSCMIRDPRSCPASQSKAGTPPGRGLASNGGGAAISPAGSPTQGGPGAPGAVSNDPAQSQGQGDGDGVGGGRKHPRPGG